jgi:hypothetical protein
MSAPKPTLDDFRDALRAECHVLTCERVARRAADTMFKRLIAENQRKRLIETANLDHVTGNEYLRAQTRIDELFAEHARLMSLAYGGDAGGEVR